MKRYSALFAVVAFAVGIAATASAQVIVTCSFVNGKKVCTQGGGGGEGPEKLCDQPYPQPPITWSGSTPAWGFCATGGGGYNGHFMSRDACLLFCGGLKSAVASSFASASSQKASFQPLSPQQERLRKQVLERLGRSIAPSAPAAAYSAVTGVVRSISPSVSAPARAVAPSVSADAYRAPRALPTAVPVAVPPAYYAAWMRPAPKTCSAAIDEQGCRAAAAAVQGNSMGTPRNTCEWSREAGQCRLVQLPLEY